MKRDTQSSMRKTKAAIKRKKIQDKDNAVDRISQLDDDILISIISHLTLREATATSILSTRWRHLYTYTTRLNFPPFKPKTCSYSHRKYRQKIQETKENLIPSYISMINRTLDSHKGGQVLKEFRVHMPYMKGADFERCFEFALSRKVEIIDIHMVYFHNAMHECYTLCLSNLIRKNGGRSLPGLKCLKELSLSDIDVDDGEVKFLLSNSPLLESLSIAHAERLKNVSIVGASTPKLKHLDISYSNDIALIEVCDMINLVSLRCYHLSYKYVLSLNNVPNLTEFNTSDQSGDTLTKVLSRIPPCIRDQLRLFKLWACTNYNTMLPELKNIKHLELEVPMHSDVRLFPLIEACRSLERVEMKFLWERRWTYRKHAEIFIPSPHKKLSPNLKRLKLSGYFGCPSELGFALFIVKNAAALEELIVEPCDVTRMIRRMATTRAWQQFRQITPASVNLVII